MKRFLLLIICIITKTTFTFSQVDSTIVLSDLVIHGNRISMPFSEASRNIQIITQKEIKRIPIQSIPEILAYTPGVDIRQRGPMGVQADIGIRGGTFEQTLILLNGIKLTDPQTGHHVMNVPIPLDNIEQIEVLKGPGARIYGQNAFAGAVNFITKAPDYRNIKLRAYGGSFESYGGNISVSLPIGIYKQYVSLSRDASDGYRHNTDYRINNIFYQSELPVKSGKYEVIFGLTDRKFGANGFYASPKFTDQYEAVKTSLASITYASEINNFKIKPRVYWRWNEDYYLFIRDNPGAYQNLHNTNTIGTEINSSYSSKLGITGLGIEYRQESINGDWVRGGNESKSNLDGFGRDNFGIYLDQHMKFKSKFDLTAGIYVNWYSDFGWNAFPGLDLGYNFSDKIRLYGNIGTSYRVPTFYDQYYSSPVEQGNPNLKPEEALTYEIGIRYMYKGVTLEGNLFERDASQLIDWVLDPADSVWRSQNYQDIKTMGIELSLNLDFKEIIDANFPLYHLAISYNYLNQNIMEKETVISRYAMENIRNQVIFGLDHKIVWRINNSFKLRYIDRVEQNPYILIDDKIYYEHKEKFTLFVEATNMTNQEYTEIMTPMPGRWFRAGMTLNLAY